jgi:hypothetical protein
MLEYLVLIGCLALVCAGAIRQFGVTIQRKILGYGAGIAMVGVPDEGPSRDVAPPGAGALVDGDDPAGAAPVGEQSPTEPSFSGLDPDAAYAPYAGAPFHAGVGDSSAIHPDDLAQGALGDCYLIATLGAIATRDPAFLEELVVDNCDGTYTVTFIQPNPHDWWAVWEPDEREVPITVTASFPSRDGAPVFAKPGDQGPVGAELWPMIVEKAYAQHRGGYEAIGNGGFSHDVFEALTGDRSLGWATRYVDFELAYDRWEHGAVITADTLGDEEAKDHPLFREGFRGNAPLVARHVYYVTAMDPAARTITLQNPWGWDGDGITLTWDEYQAGFDHMDSMQVRS